MLFIFSIPFTVVPHNHADVFCALTDNQTRSSAIMEDDDEDTEPDKQSKKIQQSSKQQSEFTLIKKPAKKMKRKENLKIIKRSKQIDSSFSKRLKKTKTATAQKTTKK
jgi:hypothetical protein